MPPPGKLLDTSDKSAAGPLEKRDLHIPRRRNCYKLCRFRVRRRFITWSGFFTTKKKPRVPNEISSSASTSDMAFKVGHILTVPHEKNYVGLNSENINYQLKIKLSLPVWRATNAQRGNEEISFMWNIPPPPLMFNEKSPRTYLLTPCIWNSNNFLFIY